jgi:probable non-F420 flavinoid oxidoreductase
LHCRERKLLPDSDAGWHVTFRGGCMALIGYHCSHEQFPPSELLSLVSSAHRAGFRAAMCSDHFHPWSGRQGHSGFALSWLGAAMHATPLPFGLVNAPGQRYHPAIIAQAAATLAEMFPQRFWIALGSGQLLNEHVTGDAWPAKAERQARLLECVEIIRRLWAGETVTHTGRVRVSQARLYTRPPEPPAIVGAAVSVETAEWVGSWADALITVVRPHDELARVVEAFQRGGGRGKPMFLQAQTSYAETDRAAKQAAFDQWRPNVLPPSVLTEIPDPAGFDRAAAVLSADDLDGRIRMSADVERHVRWLEQDIALGFDVIFVHQVGRDQSRFLQVFGEQVLPRIPQQPTARTPFRA